MTSEKFRESYKKLNTAQKLAVDTIDGPVMVVAGPGTGKTQVLALRIANILIETDAKADEILCLTFTNSGVIAMRDRLRVYIGAAASQVQVSTFHSFGMSLMEKYYTELGFLSVPKIIDDAQSVAIVDQILHAHDWQHIRTRANPALYFKDLKQLVSLLKRERISPEQFDLEITREIDFLKNDESSISSRGVTKGQLKADVMRKIEGLERTREIVKFYELYEQVKNDSGFIDYDDVLELVVKLVEISEDATADIRERYQYVLVDEHQDSSGVQNEFLARVWQEQETQNVFVVGDDRQLIYGFGGASLSYFEGFKETFPGVRLITLTDNYRSTQKILDTADALLSSTLADAKLISQHTESHPLRIVEAYYPRDEIIRAGLEIKEKIAAGIDPNHCAILVPKNYQVKNAIRILSDLGLPVAAGESEKLFEAPETQGLIALLRVLAYPETPHVVAPILLDPLSGVPLLVAHQYLVSHDARKLTLSSLLSEQTTLDLFVGDNSITSFAQQLASWLPDTTGDLYQLVQKIGDEWLVKTAPDHETLTRRVEIIRTFLHLILARSAQDPDMKLPEFLQFIDRLREYGTDIPLAVFGAHDGVQVMTMHGSKGLEFDYVWIAHMDHKGLQGKAGGAFTIPESIRERMEERDEEVIKRQVYVAITRAKRFCTISYATTSYTGGAQELSHAVANLPGELFDRYSATDTEQYIRSHDDQVYVTSDAPEHIPVTLEKLATLVGTEYATRKLSVTHLNNFFSCPWKWYFRNFLQLPEVESISLQLGNLVHGCIEKILKEKLDPKQKELLQIITEHVEKIRGLSESDERSIIRDAEKILSVWVKHRLHEITVERETEKPLSYRDPDFDHLLITGKIDLVEKIGFDTVRVTDFKTGKPKSKSELEKSDGDHLSDYLRQLAMYSYLMSGSTKGREHVGESRLEFVEADHDHKDAIYDTVITRDQIELLRNDIKEFDQALSNGEWVHRACNHKPFRGEECVYCKLAQIYKNN